MKILKQSLAAKAIVCLILACPFVSAQVPIYMVEHDTVYLPDGTNLNRNNIEADGRNVTVYGGIVSSVDAAQSAFADFSNAQSADDRLSSFQNVIQADTFTWLGEPIPAATEEQADNLDWFGLRSTTSGGSFPVLFVSTNPIDELTVNSFVGIVLSDTAIPDVGSVTIGFNTGTQRWNTGLVGDLNSLTLAAIPEPRVSAALFGVFALGFVLWRRRRA